jgi:hypothetical protein
VEKEEEKKKALAVEVHGFPEKHYKVNSGHYGFQGALLALGRAV